MTRCCSIEAGELSGKYIILDVLARDADGHQYNVEMQVRRYNAWGQRSLYYLAHMLSDQLDAGRDYRQLKAAVGIHLLDFDLFSDGEKQLTLPGYSFDDDGMVKSLYYIDLQHSRCNMYSGCYLSVNAYQKDVITNEYTYSC